MRKKTPDVKAWPQWLRSAILREFRLLRRDMDEFKKDLLESQRLEEEETEQLQEIVLLLTAIQTSTRAMHDFFCHDGKGWHSIEALRAGLFQRLSQTDSALNEGLAHLDSILKPSTWRSLKDLSDLLEALLRRNIERTPLAKP